ncbi:hypothetical protein DL767_007950 [Monosporascus sp. MG133]|nr:hypothetical protein DL767_007950 [Monosporascus sp. MG133]
MPPQPTDTDLSSDDGYDSESLKSSKPEPRRDGPVTWMSLPRKDQLLILFISRVVDFLQVASLQAFVFFQLKHLNRNLTDAEISTQAGWLQGAFTGAQVLTAMLWGKAADATWGGRKKVLFIGLFGTAISCMGYGFATSFSWLVFWRMFGGAINGTVGIIRTMVAEITVEKKYQSRAFLILPISFNVAGLLGPLMGGFLADPATHLPGIFGPGAIFGFDWVQEYPYALPSLINAFFLATAGWTVFFALEETSPSRRGKFDIGLHLAGRFKNFLLRRQETEGYSKLQMNESWDSTESSLESVEEKSPVVVSQVMRRSSRKLPFHRLFTKNVIFTLVTEAFYDFHLGAFQNLWTLFLSTPRSLPEQDNARRLPFAFTGGLGMPAATVGFATSILGVLGMLLQVFLYPPVQARLGTLRGFQIFLGLFPLAYFIAPYLAVLPSSSPAPEPASGILIWIGIVLVLLFQVTGRTITLPASIILLNNCSPHPTVLGTIHGLGQSVSAGFRTVGPIVGGWWYGSGLEIGMVGASWWGIAGMSALGCAAATCIYEGSGHEIFLDEEEQEMMALKMEELRK